MADYDNKNRGALFKNNRKTKDTHPNLTGKIDIDGVEYWLSGWTKESRGGDKYISLSLGDRVDVPSGTAVTGKKDDIENFDDDIPF
jgi:hypothetical protein